jgi:predicted enzyme related to lactoylglutathione lyase
MQRPTLPGNKAEKLITFIYYRDLQKGIDFYGKTLGFPMEIDQGWCKIYRISEGGYIGVVDEKRGMHRWHPVKPVQICLRVPNVDEFYAYCRQLGLDGLSEMFESRELAIRAFVFNDPEGYQLEIQQSIS